MHEELWQSLVGSALVRSLNLKPECLYAEVPTREGSRVDLLYATVGRLLAFELKMADDGEASRSLAPRDCRQLRHYRAACHAVYLVTVGGPRRYSLVHGGNVVHLEPLEAQLVPKGCGWIAFDRLSLEAHILVPAPELRPKDEDRQFVVDHLLTRLGRATKQLKALRAGA